MINIANLSYHYPSAKHNVIESLDLELLPGRICGLLGENGVGKTTLLGLMCGILRPTSGSVSIDSDEVSLRNADTLAKIYYVPDEFALPSISLENYVKVNAPFYPNFNKELLDDCLATFDMQGKVKRLDQLSLGQRKKVMLSFAVASGTDIVLMDEPTNGLDIPSKSLFRKIIAKAMSDNRLLVISTHQVHDVEQILDQIVIMDNTRVLLNNSVGEISDKYTFDYVPKTDVPADTLYSETTPAGMAIIRLKHPEDAETQVNLELLFNAAVKGNLK